MFARLTVMAMVPWVMCCPALCQTVHPMECPEPASAPHGPHEHEHDCFCSGDSLPTPTIAKAAPALVQPVAAVNGGLDVDAAQATPAAADIHGDPGPTDLRGARILPLLI